MQFDSDIKGLPFELTPSMWPGFGKVNSCVDADSSKNDFAWGFLSTNEVRAPLPGSAGCLLRPSEGVISRMSLCSSDNPVYVVVLSALKRQLSIHENRDQSAIHFPHRGQITSLL